MNLLYCYYKNNCIRMIITHNIFILWQICQNSTICQKKIRWQKIKIIKIIKHYALTSKLQTCELHMVLPGIMKSDTEGAVTHIDGQFNQNVEQTD